MATRTAAAARSSASLCRERSKEPRVAIQVPRRWRPGARGASRPGHRRRPQWRLPKSLPFAPCLRCLCHCSRACCFAILRSARCEGIRARGPPVRPPHRRGQTPAPPAAVYLIAVPPRGSAHCPRCRVVSALQQNFGHWDCGRRGRSGKDAMGTGGSRNRRGSAERACGDVRPPTPPRSGLFVRWCCLPQATSAQHSFQCVTECMSLLWP